LERNEGWLLLLLLEQVKIPHDSRPLGVSLARGDALRYEAAPQKSDCEGYAGQSTSGDFHYRHPAPLLLRAFTRALVMPNWTILILN